MNKYGNIRTNRAGRSFASKGEAELFDLLDLWEREKKISELRHQHHVYLTDARICYIPDFSAVDALTGTRLWYEYKGFETPEWRIKKRLWAHYGPGILHVYKGYGRRLQCVETVIPETKFELVPAE